MCIVSTILITVLRYSKLVSKELNIPTIILDMLAQGYNHRFLILMITKRMWLFSTNQVQVFKCVSGFKRIQEVFFIKRKVYEDSRLFKKRLKLKRA